MRFTRYAQSNYDIAMNPNNLYKVIVPAAALALALLMSDGLANAADTATYAGLPPDQFLKNWLILAPVPVAGEGQGAPDEAAQKQAFAEDWFAGQGGAGSVQPRAGMKQAIGGINFEWRLVESRADTVDLKAASGGGDFAIAYAWAEIDLPERTRCLLGIGSDDAVKVWLNGQLGTRALDRPRHSTG